MAALDLPYEHYVEINGGVEECGICQAKPKTRRLQRDHDHRGAYARGILCPRCNKNLPYWVTPDWLEKAKAYLERAEARQRGSEVL